jgi:DinB superfamily/Pentapeptide repeats (8 copies)
MTNGSQSFRGAHFIDMDMSGAVFREVDLTGVRMYGVLLTGADIDGDIRGLTVNGVEVAPLIEAELDRMHPERTTLRPTTPQGVLDACAVVQAMWEPTLQRAEGLSEADRHRGVNDEWSLTETLRHLVFVTDAWFSHAILGQARPFHPYALPAAFIADAETFGIDLSARPAYHEVLDVRAGRWAMLREFAEAVTQDDLDRVREPNPAPGWPPPAPRTAISCLQVIFNDEWAHHQFAIRDLAHIEGEA